MSKKNRKPRNVHRNKYQKFSKAEERKEEALRNALKSESSSRSMGGITPYTSIPLRSSFDDFRPYMPQQRNEFQRPYTPGSTYILL